MSRIDDLLAAALASGAIPEDVTDAERDEVRSLLAAAGAVRGSVAKIDMEAGASQPVARARFQRFVADSGRIPVQLATERRRGWLGRLLGGNRFVLSGVAAAVIGVIAVVALVGSQALTSSTDTANALSLDDYVQVQGLVTAADASHLSLQSDIGTVTASLSDSTSTANGSPGTDGAHVGDTVLVSGVVNGDRSISVSTVAVVKDSEPAPTKVTPKLLKTLKAGLSGRVLLLSIAKDGQTARVIIQTQSGERLLVKVDAATAESLLTRTGSVLGTAVSVTEGDKPNDGLFALSVAESQRPATFAGVRGVVTGRELNVIEVVDAQRQVVLVAVRGTTRILFANSGLTAADALKPGEAVVGHEVAVTGGKDARTGRIIADVIVIGPKLSR